MVVAGEVAVSLNNYASNADSMKRPGKAIDWKPSEPGSAAPGPGLAAAAPPFQTPRCSCRLSCCPEGQQLFNSMGPFPREPKVKSDLVAFPI